MNTFMDGVSIAIIGVLVVGITLGLISSVLYLLKYAGGTEPKKAEQPVKQVSDPVTPSLENNIVTDNEQEVVAVIMAAIAASMNTTVDNLVVRSFRKIPGKNPVV